jgi:hypothetical protein
LCEYRTGKEWFDRSLSWHDVACLIVPFTSTWPPELPNTLGVERTDIMTAWGVPVLAEACVATRPKVMATTVTKRATIFFIGPALLS